jgi:hypothetical protein
MAPRLLATLATHERDFHIAAMANAVAWQVMRRAFVLQLGSGTQPAERHFEGGIEEVDTSRELRFRSTEELLSFLAECYE